VFFSSRRRHTRSKRDWSSDVCSSDLGVDDLECLLGGVHASTEADQVRVVVFTCQAGGLHGPGQCAACALDLVRGDLLTVAGSTQIGRASCRESGWIAAGAGATRKMVD